MIKLEFDMGRYLKLDEGQLLKALLLQHNEPEPQPDVIRLNDISANNIDSQFFLVNISGKVSIMRWGKSSYDPRVRVPEFMAEEHFHRALKNKWVSFTGKGGEKKRKPLSQMWLQKPGRYTHDGLMFDSTRNAKDEINLWRGFGFEPQPGDWSYMREHIKVILAAGDTASDDYLMNWLAWVVQNPTKAAEVAVALTSKEKGTGKGFLGRAMCRLFGGHGLQIVQRSHLVGKFNAHLGMCGFLFSDEALWPGYKEDEAVLKGIITEPRLQIEKKGQDTYTMPNALKIMMASNSDRVVPASEDDRRYAVFEVSTKRMQDTVYFKRMQKQLDAGGYAAMLHDLQALDLGGWHPRNDIPETKGLAKQKLEALPPELKWMRGLLDAGTLPGQHATHANEAKASFLFDDLTQHPDLRRWSADHLAQFLKEWGCERKRNNGSWWVFPPLAGMRAKWKKQRTWDRVPFGKHTTEWRLADTPGDDFPDR